MNNIFTGIAVVIICVIFMGSVANAAEPSYINEDYQKYATKVAEENGICPEFIIAMIEVESSGRPGVVSKDGAVGLMQVMPKYHTERMKQLGVTDLSDPYQNIRCGVDILLELFEKYEDAGIVLTCYNAGEYGSTANRAINDGYISKYAKKILERSAELERVDGK